MLEALLKGQATPEELSQFAKGGAKKKIPQLIAAWEGHPMRDPHRRMIRYCVDPMRFGGANRAVGPGHCSEDSRSGYGTEWRLVQSVPGVQENSAATILAETGTDRTQFPSQKHLSSWTGICPGNNRSAGQNRSRHTTGGNRWLRGTLNECAWAAAAKKDCFLKDKFWRITTQSGGQEGAGDHRDGPQLVDSHLSSSQRRTSLPGKQAPVSDPLHKQGMIRHPIRRLGKLGVRVHGHDLGSSPTATSPTES
jgi:hypothetical protein